MSLSPRVALFTDSFFEPNGVATLTRNLTEFARRENIPFFCAYGGNRTVATQEGSLTLRQCKRSAASVRLDRDLYCDLLLNRYRNRMVQELRAFRPDLIHITGPGDFGVLGFWVAHILRIPLVASWHTNLHEYVRRRLEQMLSWAPHSLGHGLAAQAERQSLRALLRFYRLPRFTLAPNRETVDMLQRQTGRPSFLMRHGVDLSSFAPRPSGETHRPFCIGFVGRLTPEKNIRYFKRLERDLQAAGETGFRFLLVGEGSEYGWLKRNLQSAEMPGVLRGPELAAAFARMDAFVFPSQTDTFGLVLLEAMASGVPVVLSKQAGLRLGLEDGQGGCASDCFSESVLRLMRNEDLRQGMALAARRFAQSSSWDEVFRHLYLTYERGLAGLKLALQTSAQ